MSQIVRSPSRWIVGLGVVAMLTAGAVYWWNPQVVAQEGKAQEGSAQSHAKALSSAFRSAAEKTVPTVVKIVTHSAPVAKQGNRSSRENPFRGTPLEDFFGDEMQRRFNTDQMPRDGMGSGVIIDSAGIILTNNHVVADADEVVVHLADGREFKTADIKTDTATDLAVVRIKGAGTLPAARMGDSDKLETGDWVIAVGHPFELETTVSAGIISGKGRSLGSVRRAKFLQTDAAINPGNSGGPLVNLDGEVIGINTAIATNNGGYQGIGFAIPINTARWVVSQLIERGTVQRGYLGVGIEEVSHTVASKLGVPDTRGVLVTEIYPKTPAADAGFQEGDVITEFDGHRVVGPRELQELVERTPLDTKHPVTLYRDGKTMKLDVVVKALPDKLETARLPSRISRDGDLPTYENSDLGLEVSELTAEQAKMLGFEDLNGVLVTRVDPNGPAYEKGLRDGMLVMRVGRKQIASLEDFQQALEAANLKEGVLLLLRTSAGNRIIALQTE